MVIGGTETTWPVVETMVVAILAVAGKMTIEPCALRHRPKGVACHKRTQLRLPNAANRILLAGSCSAPHPMHLLRQRPQVHQRRLHCVPRRHASLRHRHCRASADQIHNANGFSTKRIHTANGLSTNQIRTTNGLTSTPSSVTASMPSSVATARAMCPHTPVIVVLLVHESATVSGRDPAGG